MKQIDIFKRDNLLVEYLFSCKGKSNIATAKDISDYLCNRGYITSTQNVHLIVRKVMFERKLPICSLNSKGYYWGTNKQELLEAVTDLEGRIEEMQNRIEILKGFVIE